ncbi:MAG: hypothetical protein WC382_07485 [Methanoregulaceae archaeon]|jgi:hypothetical protein
MKLSEETNLPLDVILLLAFGLIMFVIGAVLLTVAAGALPYYEEGVYGLLLVMFGLQLQTTGKIPIEFAKRSWSVLIPGIIITVIGFVTCFVPGILGTLPQLLVMVIFGVGGILLLVQLFSAKEKYRFRETSADGLIQQLTLSSAMGCSLEILIAGLIAVQIFLPGILSTNLLAFSTLLLSMSLFNLAFSLRNVYQLHPESDMSTKNPAISLDTVMGMQYGFYMLVLGCLLVPINLGLLPYAISAIHGTLVVLFGVQAMVAGRMMTFAFKRNWIFLIVGMMFVAVGAFAVIVPDMVVEYLIFLIGVLIIPGGFYLLYTLFGPKPTSGVPAKKPEGNDIRLMIFLLVLALLTAILMILFGISLLIENLIPGIGIAIILICFGLSQFVLQYVLSIAVKKNLIE